MAKKIVIIEDEPSISQMYQFKLESEGFKVKIANDSPSGVKLVDEFKPDIVLLDIMMPYETGDKTLEKIRMTPFGKKLKVLMMTNTDLQNAPDGIREFNFKRYVIKASMTPKQVSQMVRDELADKS